MSQQSSPGEPSPPIVSPSHGPKSPGTRKSVRYFGEYELLEEIARGGMGVVYKARQVKLNRLVALKMILSGQLASEADVQRFHTEAEAAANLDHIGIVPIFEVGEHEGQHFFSMGYIEGDNLSGKLRHGPLPPREAAELTQKIAEAIAYAHSQGVIHRDLKPANVLLTEEGQPKITDFGLAKKVEGNSALTATGQILGTPGFMPPEQAAGDGDKVGPLADVYSIGAILYNLLTDRPPFQSAAVMDTLMQVLEQEPIRPGELNAGVDRDLETICLKCLEKEPRRRYPTADALAEELGRFLRGEPIEARPISRLSRAWRWCKRKPVIASLGSTVAALILFVAITGPLTALQQSALREAAEQNAQDAKQSQALAEEQTLIARSAEADLQKEHERIRRLLYATNISLAYREWQDNNPLRAEQILHECPEPLRNWEWHYLRSLNRKEQLSLFGHTGPVGSVIFGPEGQRILTAGVLDNTVKVWNAATGRELQSFSAQVLKSIDLNHDASQALVGDRDNLHVVNTENGQTIRKFSGPGSAVKSAMFVNNDEQVAVAYEDGSIILFDAKTGEESHRCPQKITSARNHVFSPDGSLVASNDGPRVLVRDVRSGEPKFKAEGHVMQALDFAFSPAGTTLATAGAEGSVMLWDTQSGKRLHRLHAHRNWVMSLAFSPDGTKLATGSRDRTCRVFDIETATELLVIRGHSGDIRDVAFSPDGTQIASASDDGRVNLWKIDDRMILAKSVQQRLDQESAHSLGHVGGMDAVTVYGHLAPGFDVEISPDGQWIATVAMASSLGEEQVKVWSLKDFTEYAGFPTPGGQLHRLAFSPDSKYLSVTTGGANNVQDQGVTVVWELSTKERFLDLPGVPCMLSDSAFNRNGDRLAIAYGNQNLGKIQIWSFPAGKQLHEIPISGEKLSSVVFTPDGSQLLTSAFPGKKIRIWDVHTGNESESKMLLDNGAFCLVMSPQGLLASANTDQSISIWDWQRQEERGKLIGHNSVCIDLAFSPDGKRLLSSSEDMTSKLWDVDTFRELLTFHDHRGKVFGAAWGANGETIATTGADGALKIRRATIRGTEDRADWITLFEDDFERDQPGPHWDNPEYNWQIENGRLAGSLIPVPVSGTTFPGIFATLQSIDLPNTVEISVDVRPESLMTVGIPLTTRSTLQQIQPFVAPTVVPFGFAGSGVLLMRNLQEGGVVESKILGSRSAFRMEPGKTYRFHVLREERKLTFSIDGRQLESLHIPNIPAEQLVLAGTWSSVGDRISFDNLLIRVPPSAQHQRAIRSLVENWYDESLVLDVVESRIQKHFAQSPDDREYALKVAAEFSPQPDRALAKAWETAQQSDGTPEDYELAYRQAMDFSNRKPDHWPGWHVIAFAILRAGKAEEALESFDRSIARFNEEVGFPTPWPRAGRALSLHAMGKIDEGKREHLRYLDLKRNGMWQRNAKTLDPLTAELAEKLPLDRDPERDTILDQLIATEKALWFERDVEKHFAIRAPEFISIEGREEQQGPFDAEFDRETTARFRAVQTTNGFMNRPQLIWEETTYDRDGKTAMVGWVSVSRTGNYLHKFGKRYELEKRNDQWIVLRERSWPILQGPIENRTVFDVETWQTHDRTAEKAMAAGQLALAARALWDGRRFQEAYEAITEHLQGDSVTAADQAMHGEFALLLGKIEEGSKALAQARKLDPAVEMPWFAIRHRGSYQGHTNAVYGFDLSPDETTLASVGGDQTLRLWDRKTRQLLETVEDAHGASISDVMYSTDGKLLVSGGRDVMLKLWDAKTGQKLQELSGHLGQVYRLGAHPTRNRVVSSSVDGTAKIWDLDLGREIASLVGHQSNVMGAEFSPDGMQIATASNDGTIRLWDAETGKQVGVLTGHTAGVWRVDWTPDGQNLVSVSKDQTVRIWESTTRKLIKTLEGHQAHIEAVRVSPDGRIAASADVLGEIWIWDLTEQKALGVLRAQASVYNVKFSRHGKSLFSSSANQLIQEWNVDFQTNPFAEAQNLQLD